jgi:hypothetical protein
MNKLGYQTSVPSRADIERTLKYSMDIVTVANQNNYYRFSDQHAFEKLREDIERVYNETFEDTAWRHTAAYLVTANAVR